MGKIKYYHYTRESKLDEIINSGHINLAIESVCDKKREKACSWVSINPNWENTATKILINDDGTITKLTFKEQLEICGCARIEVKTSFGFINWGKIKYLAKMNLTIAKAMEETGLSKVLVPKNGLALLNLSRVITGLKRKFIRMENGSDINHSTNK